MGTLTLIRPGSVFLILVIASMFFSLHSWTTESLLGSENSTLERQEETVRCSSISVDFLDQNRNETHHTVFIRVDEPLETLNVTFEGEEIETRILENVRPNEIIRVEAELSSVSGVTARVPGCENSFE